MELSAVSNFQLLLVFNKSRKEKKELYLILERLKSHQLYFGTKLRAIKGVKGLIFGKVKPPKVNNSKGKRKIKVTN